MTRLGPYDVLDHIGQGAAGRVLGGVHRATGTPVAVKLARADIASNGSAQSALIREIELIAALEHPAIVAVLDGGFLSEPFTFDGTTFQAGWPYMVVERASGTLEDYHPRDWEDARELLLALLEGLAFAHARGVVHRDLKPDNILLVGDRFKIGDFGISGIYTRSHDAPSAGSPQFMAPEQFRGAARDQIPSTDLYALGGIAYALVCGRPPFEAANYLDFARAHLESPPPRLDPRFDIPDGLEPWIHRLLAKRQVERFVRAADAIAAFARLDDPTAWSVAGERGDQLPSIRAPAVPATWRRDIVPRTDELVAASSSLFGLRTPPVVGRDAERDQLWDALVDVHRSGHARVVLLEGNAGCGKSCLARWLRERADEVGAATSMVAYGDRTRGGTGALLDMVAKYLRSEGVRQADAATRARDLFEVYGLTPDWRLDALERLLRELAPDGDTIHLDPGERSGLLWSLLAIASAGRPIIVHVDDAHHCEAALELVLEAFRDERPAAKILFVLTLQREALAEAPAARELVSRIQDLPGCERILISELSRAEVRTLLRELLRLDARLIDRLAERVGGNPLFAVQLVSDWVAREALTYQDGGLHLDPSVWPKLPDDIWHVWRERLRRSIGNDGASWRALEIAAILGREIAHSDWTAICDSLNLVAPNGLIPNLVARGLVVSENRGWAFVHPMLREALLRECREGGRWERFNRAVGIFVEGSALLPEHDRLGRAARFLIQGRDPRGIEVLHRAIVSAIAYGDHYFVLELRGLVAEAVGGEPSWATAQLCELEAARALGRLGQPERGLDIVRESIRAGRARNDDLVVARACIVGSSLSRVIGRLTDAAKFAEDALARFDAANDTDGAATATLEMADHYSYMSRYREAQELYDVARRYFAQQPSTTSLARAQYGIGYCHQQRGEVDLADAYLRQSYELYRELGAYSDAFGVLLSLGDVSRERGELDLAERQYRECADFFEATGDGSGAVVYLNLAHVALARADFESARGYTEYGAAAIARWGYESLRGGVHALALVCDAAERDWKAWDRDLAALPAWIHTTGVLERDDVAAVEHAAELASRAGERSRAARAYELALDLWERANDGGGVSRVRAALDKLA